MLYPDAAEGGGCFQPALRRLAVGGGAPDVERSQQEAARRARSARIGTRSGPVLVLLRAPSETWGLHKGLHTHRTLKNVQMSSIRKKEVANTLSNKTTRTTPFFA
jgi:hypothetical protein